MFRRVLSVSLLAAGFLAATSVQASAVMLDGAFSKTGFFNPVTCVAGVCAVSNLLTATAIDVTNVAGTPSFGTAGNITAGDGSGTLGALVPNGTAGTMADFAFVAGGGSGQFPNTPVAVFEVFPGLTFSLNTVTRIATGADNLFLLLSGTGTFTAAGFDPTPGDFTFSSQTVASGATFSFSASQGATPPPAVPEPGSLMLLGTGLFGLATAARRRLSRR